MKRLFLILTLGCLLSVGWAQKLEYRAQSMGFKVADICMNIGDNRLTVKASNSGMRTLFPHLNNYYQINWQPDFLPKNYLRRIHQDSYRDSVFVQYNAGHASMQRQKKPEKLNYNVPPQCRDFFSFLMKICQSQKPIGEYHVDGDGRIWLANVQGGEIESVKTGLGKFQCSRYEISFKPLSPEKATYVDMLTFNFLAQDMLLVLWVNQGSIPIKAQLKKKLVSMSWEITSIS